MSPARARVALYARVSTGGQTAENQLLALRAFAGHRGWTATVFTDQGVSGAREKRPALDALLAAARLMELVGVYGDALRERSNELWGDGILSAIDCKVTLEKKGERGVITIDAKFLHYKEF